MRRRGVPCGTGNMRNKKTSRLHPENPVRVRIGNTADVIAASKKADGTYAYRWERKEILNNIVRFKNS